MFSIVEWMAKTQQRAINDITLLLTIIFIIFLYLATHFGLLAESNRNILLVTRFLQVLDCPEAIRNLLANFFNFVFTRASTLLLQIHRIQFNAVGLYNP